jgi:hypothetical protein
VAQEVCSAGSCIALLANVVVRSSEEADAVDNDVVISIDPHKTSNTAGPFWARLPIQWFANTPTGYRQLRTFGDQRQQRRRAVEG